MLKYHEFHGLYLDGDSIFGNIKLLIYIQSSILVSLYSSTILHVSVQRGHLRAHIICALPIVVKTPCFCYGEIPVRLRGPTIKVFHSLFFVGTIPLI